MTNDTHSPNVNSKTRTISWRLAILPSLALLLASAQPASAIYPGVKLTAAVAPPLQSSSTLATWGTKPRFGSDLVGYFVSCEGADIVVRWKHQLPTNHRYAVHRLAPGSRSDNWQRVAETNLNVFVDHFALLHPNAGGFQYRVTIEPLPYDTQGGVSARILDNLTKLE
jgi:hypothetical protein